MRVFDLVPLGFHSGEHGGRHEYSRSLARAHRLKACLRHSDNRQWFPVYDQGKIGSCTANALAGAIQFDRLKSKQSPDFTPSRLFIYFNERAIEGTELLARAFQHEMDHLEGTVFVDRLRGIKKDVIVRRIQKLKRSGKW